MWRKLDNNDHQRHVDTCSQLNTYIGTCVKNITIQSTSKAIYLLIMCGNLSRNRAIYNGLTILKFDDSD